MYISLNTTEELSDTDRAVLAVLSGGASTSIGTLVVDVKEDIPAGASVEAPTKPGKPLKVVKDPEPGPEVDHAEVMDEPDDEPEPTHPIATKDDAVKITTEFVQAGKSAVVKAALEQLITDPDVPKRVSSLEGEQFGAYVALLKEA